MDKKIIKNNKQWKIDLIPQETIEIATLPQEWWATLELDLVEFPETQRSWLRDLDN